MKTKYDIGDAVITSNFTGVISMITISTKGVRYRGYGTYQYEDGTKIGHHQHDFWEDEVEEVIVWN